MTLINFPARLVLGEALFEGDFLQSGLPQREVRLRQSVGEEDGRRGVLPREYTVANAVVIFFFSCDGSLVLVLLIAARQLREFQPELILQSLVRIHRVRQFVGLIHADKFIPSYQAQQYMSYYTLTNKQEQLLLLYEAHGKLSNSPQQRHETTHLQLYGSNHKLYLKSMTFHNRLVRLVLVGFMIRLFGEYKQQYEDSLNRLKNIVYAAELRDLTTSNLKDKQYIMMAVALEFSKIKIGSTYNDIIFLFNCKQYFDEVLCLAIEHLVNTHQKTTLACLQPQEQLQAIVNTFKHEFKLDVQEMSISREILLDSEQLLSLETVCICFMEKNQPLLQISPLKQFSFIETDSESENSALSRNLLMYQTINISNSCSSSPAINENLLQNSRLHNCSPFELQLQKTSGQFLQSDTSQTKTRHHRKEPPKQQSSLWDIFCCRDAQ